MREVAAVRQLEAQDRVAGVQQREVGGGVRLRAGVGLDVDVVAPEHLLGAVDRQLLGDVHELAAAVVALAGEALGVLVGEVRALAVEDRLGDEVLGGDHLQRPLLALELVLEDIGDRRIDLGERTREVLRAQIAHRRGDDSASASSSAGIAPSRTTDHSPVSS